jgi:hypothetical protein
MIDILILKAKCHIFDCSDSASLTLTHNLSGYAKTNLGHWDFPWKPRQVLKIH